MKLLANPPTARVRFTGSRGAFTLIELLVVIAIISLLLAVLLPSLRSAKQRAKQAACLSNLRHLALAWREYLDENDGAFLQWINANYNYGGQQGTNQFPWPPFLGPYDAIPKPLNRYVGAGPVAGRFEVQPTGERVRTSTDEAVKVFCCPADDGTDLARPTSFEFYGTSYRTNEMLIGQDQLYIHRQDPCKPVMRAINDRLERLNVSKVTTNQSELVLLGDIGWVDEWLFWHTQRFEWHDEPRTYNLAFLDGHADFVRIRKGIHVDANYTVIAFRDLAEEAAECQEEVP